MTREEIIGEQFKIALLNSSLEGDELRLIDLKREVDVRYDKAKTEFASKLLLEFSNDLDEAIKILHEGKGK